MTVPLVVVSPHLDDAVLSCGRLLAAHPGAVVVTVFAGPPPDDRLVEWDRLAGFVAGDDVMTRRQREDRRALRVLRARPVWLGLRQDVYRDAPLDVAALRAQVAAVIEVADPALVAVPIGLHHPDHLAVADALGGALPDRQTWLYADQPYATGLPHLLPARLARLPALRPVPGPARGRWRKTLAISAYRSQLRALGGGIPRHIGGAPETYWEVSGG